MNLKTTYWSKDVKQCCCHWVFCFSVDKKAADMWMKSYQLFFFLCVCEKVSSGQGQLGSRWASVGYAPSHSHILLSGHRVTVIQTHIARRHKRGGGVWRDYKPWNMTMNTFRKYSEFWKHQESVHISCSERFVRLKCENPLKTPSVSYFQQQIIWKKKKHRKDCHLQHSCSKLYTVGKQEKFSTDCLDFPHPHHLRQLSQGGGGRHWEFLSQPRDTISPVSPLSWPGPQQN